MVTINRTTDKFRTESVNGNIRRHGIYVGVIKGNKDPQRNGRLSVYIPEFGGDPDDENNWYVVQYASPFAGATNVEENIESGEGKDKMYGSQRAYGWWAIPPDINNEVLVCFANGDTARGYWFACLYQPFMNHMVPAVGINVSTDDSINEQNLPPVVEFNRKDESQSIWEPKRPVFEPLHNGLSQQGLYTDPERGPATTGARRESPSKVFGMISPRGNNIHIDDNEENEFIRLRTRSGVQILIHETTGYIYMISKEGNSWMEISDEGIDLYSKRSISLRAEENINLHADHSIIMHGAGAVHGRGGNHTFASESQSTVEVKGDSKQRVGGSHTTDAVSGIQRSSTTIQDAGSPSTPNSV